MLQVQAEADTSRASATLTSHLWKTSLVFILKGKRRLCLVVRLSDCQGFRSFFGLQSFAEFYPNQQTFQTTRHTKCYTCCTVVSKLYFLCTCHMAIWNSLLSWLRGRVLPNVLLPPWTRQRPRAVHLVKRVDDSVDRTGGEDVRRFRNGRITSRTHEDRRLPWVSPINIGPIPARWNPWWDALLSQERQSQVPLVPLIHGPAEDAIEAQSAAAGPDGREAGSKATELAWLFALTTRKGKKKRFGVTT